MLFWIEEFKSEEKVNTQFTIQHEAIGSTKHFNSPSGKNFKEECVHILNKTCFILITSAVQKSFQFKDGSCESAGKVKLERTQCVSFVNFLNVDVHLNIGNELSANCCLHEMNSSLFLVRFLIQFCLLFVQRMNLRDLVCFMTRTLAQVQFQTQVRLLKTNVVIPISFNFKHCSFH